MDDTTRQVLIRRVRALRKQVEPLLADLQDAERALAFLGVSPEEVNEPPSSEVVASGPTMKEMTLQSLKEDYPDGATCGALIGHFEKRYGRKVGNTSLSSQLAKLRKAGILELDGIVWKLISEGAAS